jgi:replicative DNA helicase
LESWSNLKIAFLDSAYSSIYSAVRKHYDNYSTIPSFEELDLTLRDGLTKQTLEAVKLAEAPEVSIDVAMQALLDIYTQNELIKELEPFVDKITHYDSTELKDNFASILLRLDDKTHSNKGVFSMADIMLFRAADELARERIPLGINNTFDSIVQTARGEYILIGGKRGSGKSIIVNNVFVNQYVAGNTAAYFTIEMSGHETLERTMSILTGVDHQAIKKDNLSPEEALTLVKARADMFIDADALVADYVRHKDKHKFEAQLIRSRNLKEDNQLIIIDDMALTVTTLDVQIGKLKAKFGDKLTVVVVDYINQIRIEGTASYDWQPQIAVSTKLKELARKHDVLMVSPYQIDSSGEARFSKGILDAADIALITNAHSKEDGAISFGTTKIRGASEMIFTSPIDWTSLAISPQSIDAPKSKSDNPEKKSRKPKQDDTSADIPWDT